MTAHLKETHSYFHAFCVKPKVKFESQQVGEEVILILRRHPITQLSWIINTIFLFILLVFLNFFLTQIFPLAPNQIIVFNAFAVVFIFSYVWINTLFWLFNVGIVTNIRILDLDLYNVLYKEMTATKLEQISDVTSKIGGFFGSFFQYGLIVLK